jgi:signal transduction histidine kinase
MVVEELVEGGMTRLAVFFYQKVPKLVGPVRSMRATDIGIVKPAKAVLVASGGAPPTVRRIKDAGIHTFTEGATGYQRDGSRRAPYNLFMDLEKLSKKVKAKDHVDSYLPFGSADGWWMPLVFVLGVLGVAVVPLLAQAMVKVDILLARRLLGSGRREQVEQLTERVDTLTQTREAAVDSAEVERRRIERDLHDGPQQRLVAIAMDLGMAQERIDRDPSGARELLDKAHAASKEAITEMRMVARGIHPPILTDRGLDAALSALAARSPVPVTVRVDLPIRPSPTVEAIAYFCVSEALTNVAKHAHAGSARVDVHASGTVANSGLQIQIQDDGVGGADPARGTGLHGLADRVRAIDGSLTVHSPIGGPTLLTIDLPGGRS